MTFLIDLKCYVVVSEIFWYFWINRTHMDPAKLHACLWVIDFFLEKSTYVLSFSEILSSNFCFTLRCVNLAEWLISSAGNSLIHSSLICSFAHFAQIKWAPVSDSLRSLKTNERPWANRSGRSEEMSEWAIRSTNVG